MSSLKGRHLQVLIYENYLNAGNKGIFLTVVTSIEYVIFYGARIDGLVEHVRSPWKI